MVPTAPFHPQGLPPSPPPSPRGPPYPPPLPSCSPPPPATQSAQWYAWGPPNMQCRLCASCWIYWKKYGGLKTPTQLEGAARSASVSPRLSVETPCLRFPPLTSFLFCPSRSPTPEATSPAPKLRASPLTPPAPAGPNCWLKTGRPSCCRPPGSLAWPAGCAGTSCSRAAPPAAPTPPSMPTPSKQSVND